MPGRKRAEVKVAAVSSQEDESDYSEVENELPVPREELSMIEMPAAAKEQVRSQLKAKLAARGGKKSKSRPKGSGVVYLGHIPYGFFEKQMEEFFAQFGKITALKLARSKRKNRSKHYGFIEFEESEVARIVAATMNGYFLYSRTLVCEFIEAADVHPELFKPQRVVPWTVIARSKHNKARTNKEHATRVNRLLKTDAKRKRKLAEMNYEFEGYSTESTATTTTTVPAVKAKAKAKAKPKAAKKTAAVAKKTAAAVEEPAKKKQKTAAAAKPSTSRSSRSKPTPAPDSPPSSPAPSPAPKAKAKATTKRAASARKRKAAEPTPVETESKAAASRTKAKTAAAKPPAAKKAKKTPAPVETERKAAASRTKAKAAAKAPAAKKAPAKKTPAKAKKAPAKAKKEAPKTEPRRSTRNRG